MPTSVLTPGTTAAASSDITITNRGTISLYRALDDFLLLADGESKLLQADEASFILLGVQAGDSAGLNEVFPVKLKDPVGGYNEIGKALHYGVPTLELGPGVYQVYRPAVTTSIGVQYDLTS